MLAKRYLRENCLSASSTRLLPRFPPQFPRVLRLLTRSFASINRILPPTRIGSLLVKQVLVQIFPTLELPPPPLIASFEDDDFDVRRERGGLGEEVGGVGAAMEGTVASQSSGGEKGGRKGRRTGFGYACNAE